MRTTRARLSFTAFARSASSRIQCARSSGNIAVVAVIADKLRSFPAMCVRVTGYTNSKGDPSANKQLSKLRALVITQELTNTLKIASGALFRKQGGWAGFAIRNGRTQLENVNVGLASGTETQITGGLQEGDSMVLYPGDRVRNGQRVELINLNP